MLLEEKMDLLLKAVYKNDSLHLYDFCATQWTTDEESFHQCKVLADNLVEEKLVKYNDVQKTELRITNYGRYWFIHGGYLIYLKEGERKNGHHDERNKHSHELREELKEARLRFTHYRIVTYWWSFALSIISFFLSLLSLYLILSKK
jgi:hypothetical protein